MSEAASHSVNSPIWSGPVSLERERDYWKAMHAEALARLQESDNDDAHEEVARLSNETAKLREMLAEHQELGRLQGNRMDELARELGETQAKLRAAQGEIQRLTTLLNARGGLA